MNLKGQRQSSNVTDKRAQTSGQGPMTPAMQMFNSDPNSYQEPNNVPDTAATRVSRLDTSAATKAGLKVQARPDYDYSPPAYPKGPLNSTKRTRRS